MTPAQLEVARRHVGEYTAQLGYSAPNMTFLQGNIEDLAAAGIPDNSIDIVRGWRCRGCWGWRCWRWSCRLQLGWPAPAPSARPPHVPPHAHPPPARR
jgi:hypothetical protein